MTTKSTIALTELAKKGGDADRLRDMIQFVAQRLMDMDVESLSAAFYGERRPERPNHRNSYLGALQRRQEAVALLALRMREGPGERSIPSRRCSRSTVRRDIKLVIPQ